MYVHVPFCRARCAYCDFATAAIAPGNPQVRAYVKEVVALMGAAAATGLLGRVATAYVGGGTPTFAGAALLGDLVGSVRDATPAVRELTVEANPDSLTDEVVAALAGSGATRVSVGVQSLANAELSALGRVHDARVARRALSRAVASGLAVSADLMCATPLQTDESFASTLAGVIRLGVGHVSVYPLALETGTPLAARVDAEGGHAPWNDGDVAARRMELAADVLAEAGLARYEVASYARPGAACAHNVAYWTGVPYLGVGAAAASMLDADTYDSLRRALAPQLPVRPAAAVRCRLVATGTAADVVACGGWDGLHFDAEFLTARQAAAEDLMLGMRLVAGVGEDLLGRARAAVGPDVDAVAARVVGRGLARWRAGRLVPTARGWLLGNELYGELWDLAGGPVEEAAC